MRPRAGGFGGVRGAAMISGILGILALARWTLVGFLPARRASRASPIETLRYE